jgi:hypothetical protein
VTQALADPLGKSESWRVLLSPRMARPILGEAGHPTLIHCCVSRFSSLDAPRTLGLEPINLSDVLAGLGVYWVRRLFSHLGPELHVTLASVFGKNPNRACCQQTIFGPYVIETKTHNLPDPRHTARQRPQYGSAPTESATRFCHGSTCALYTISSSGLGSVSGMGMSL